MFGKLFPFAETCHLRCSHRFGVLGCAIWYSSRFGPSLSPLSADAADIEVLVQIHVLHVVDVADLVSAANSMPQPEGGLGRFVLPQTPCEQTDRRNPHDAAAALAVVAGRLPEGAHRLQGG